MKKTAIATLGLGLVLIAPTLRAQTTRAQQQGSSDDDEDVNAIRIEPTPAPAPRRSAASQQPDDLTIEVTAEPPPGVSPVYPQPSPGAAMYPPGYGSPYGNGYAQTFTPSRPPSPPDTPAMREHSWSRHVAVGATVGFGSPLGILGAWIDLNPSRHFGVTLGAGLGGAFGAAIGFTANVRPKIIGRWAPYVGVGFSANSTPASFMYLTNISVPSWSAWFNLEAGLEYRGPRGLFFRVGLGPTILMNTGYFTNRDSMGFYGAFYSTSIGYGPVAAADAHDQGAALALFMLHFDLGGVLDL